jgi:drug/metabolite transporter (DMT)-like permease
MSKAGLVYFGPVELFVVQLLSSALVLWLVVLVLRLPLPSFGPSFRVAAAGVLEPGLAYVVGLTGLTMTTASTAGLIGGMESLMIVGLAVIFLKERVSVAFALLAVTAVVGALMVVFTSNSYGRDEHSVLGDCLVGIGTLSAAFYVIVSRRMVEAHNPLTVLALQQLGGLVVGVLALPIQTFITETSEAVPRTVFAWGLGITSGLLQYGVAFWLYLSALKRMTAGVAGFVLNLIPLFAVVGAYAFLNESLTLMQCLGGSLIFGSLVVLSLLQLRSDAPKT